MRALLECIFLITAFLVLLLISIAFVASPVVLIVLLIQEAFK